MTRQGYEGLSNWMPDLLTHFVLCVERHSTQFRHSLSRVRLQLVSTYSLRVFKRCITLSCQMTECATVRADGVDCAV
jgi:hypothetical protein